jgi:hypothetical protein
MAVVPGDLPPPLDVRTDAQFWIDMAETEIDRQKWTCAGVDADQGVIALASHYLTSTPDGGGAIVGGVVTNESRGGVSVAVKTGSAADGTHGSTAYGQAYDRMLERVNSKRRRYLPPPPQPAA